MFNRHSVSAKLGFGFGFVVLLLLISTVLAVAGMSGMNKHTTTIIDERYAKIRLINRIALNTYENASLTRTLLLVPEEQAGDIRKRLLSIRKDTSELFNALDAMVKTAYGRELLDAVTKARKQQAKSYDTLFEITRQDKNKARDFLLNDVNTASLAFRGALDALAAYQEKQMDAEAQTTKETAVATQRWMVLLGGAAAIMSAVVAWLITRNLLRQLGGEPAYAAEIVRRVSDGDLSPEIRLRDGDRDSMLAAIATLKRKLLEFSQAQLEMAQRHKEGEVEHKMRAEVFPGVYGEIARQINELAANHVDVCFRMAGVVQRYAIGDFSCDLPQLPGTQAQLSAATAEAKRNLQAIQEQIILLSEAAAQGNFGERGQADCFQHDFRNMVLHLNRLMEVSEASLNELSEVLGAVAGGDLTRKIEGEYFGTFGKLKNDTNATIARLTQIVGSIRAATLSINAGAGEMAQGNRDLSARTEQQASSLQETASSMEELTETVRHNASNAVQANTLSQGASSIAKRGGEIVDRVVGNMGLISDSSRKIADIIGVIDSIAFQTNILALNAAVEAARAGEQGRGFAVVATEVRALAQRSGAAAHEIKGLIAASVDNVQEGDRLVAEAGQTMRDILNSVSEVTQIVSSIASASRQQSEGIEQINQAVMHMDEAVQQNAALVEEAAAAAESMETQAAQLTELVAVFHVVE